MVFLYHYGRLFPHPEWTNTISKFGWTGVDLFFVLSGYLIASPLFLKIASSKKIPLKQFFLKRFFRIIPAYGVVVAVYFCLPSVHEREALAPIWKYLTFTQNIGLDLRTQGTFSHAWSLCIEEQFYLLLPLLLAALVYFNAIKNGYRLLIALFLFGFAARYYSYQAYVAPNSASDDVWVFWCQWVYYPTWCRLDGLLVGVSIAAMLQFRPLLKERVLKYGNMLLLLSLFILAGAYTICLDEKSVVASVAGFPLVSIGYGVMLLGAISPTSFLYRSNAEITATLATLSYAIYLVHKFVVHITQEQFAKLNIADDSNGMFFICIAMVLLAAFAMNKIVEQPFLKLRDKIPGKS